MRIAVLADTHDRLPEAVVKALASADAIWHLGDVCSPSTLEPLRALKRPLLLVRGNCDQCEAWPLQLDFELEGFRIRLIHIAPRMATGCDLLLHGHTHVPRNEILGQTRFLNPGCITRPNRGAPASWAWLTLKRDEAPKWSLERV